MKNTITGESIFTTVYLKITKKSKGICFIVFWLECNHQVTISKYLKEDTFVKAHGGQRYGTFGHGVISSHQPVQNTRRCAAMCTSAETNDQYDSVCWSYQYNDVTKTCDLFAAWFAGNILEEVRFGLTKAAIASVSVYSGKVAIVTLIDLTNFIYW